MIFSVFMAFLMILFLLAAIFLFWPISYKVKFTYEQQLNYIYKVGFPFLLLWCKKEGDKAKKNLKIFGLKYSLTSVESKKPKKPAEASREKDEGFSLSVPSIPPSVKAVVNKDNLIYTGNFIVSILKTIKPNDYSFKFILGTSDPYYDGMIMILYYSFIFPRAGKEIKLKTGRDRIVFEGRGELRGRFISAVILFKFITFALSPRSLKIFYRMWKCR